MPAIHEQAARLLPATLLLLLLSTQPGCSDRGRSPARGVAASAVAADPRLEGALDLVAEAGDVAGHGALLREFEAQSACKLRLRTAAGPSGLLELAAQGDADLVLAGGDTAASLVSAGRVQALDPARVPAVSRLPAALRSLPGAIMDGHRYGVPWRWQANVLAYDGKLHADAPSSWRMLFEADASTPPASVLAGAEPTAIADAAVYLAATRPDLRIVDPYALDERQYAAVLALLKRQRAFARGISRDASSQAEGFRNGAVAAVSTPAIVRVLQAEGLPVAWTLPAEGGTAQVEIAMLHAGARHPNCAHAWMQWSLSPQVQARLAAANGRLPVLAEACALEPLAASGACARDGMALLPRLHPQRVPQARCGQRACVPYSRWTRDYLALSGEQE